MNTAFEPMYGWETINWAKVQREVFKLQKRIYRASERGDGKAVHKLQRLLTTSWYAKLMAVRRVTQDNQGKNTPGVDKVARLRNSQKISLAKKLKLSDKAQPTRRVWIPKPGKEEKRPLGIPTMEERAKQALLTLALEPEWEAKFEPNSYGFRPGRSCHDAVAAIFNGINQLAKYVLDADIEKCFDRINHEKLLNKLQTKPTFRRQIRAWLKSGVMDGEKLFPTEEGTPQGGVISPLLANIALHGMEEMLERQFTRRIENGRKRKVSFVRYADDFVVMDESLEVVQEAKRLIEQWLKEMGLALKESKTRITHTFRAYEGNVGFNFLGFHIRQYSCSDKQSGSVGGTERKRGHKTLIKPSKEGIQRHLNKIDDLLKRNGKSKQEQVINALNPVIRGWAAYYSKVASSHTFDLIDSIMHQKLMAWAKRRRSRGSNNTELVSNYWGVNRGLGWRFMTSDDKYVLKKHQDTKVRERHIKILGNRSPYDGDLIYWSNRLSQHPMLRHVVAKLLKQQAGKCSECSLVFTSTDILEVHHIDRNRGNNKLDNLKLVHRHCHDTIHSRGTVTS